MTDEAHAAGDRPAAQLVSAFAANGFPRMPASVLMAIMVSEEGALTAEELSARLGASAAAVSGAVRYLSTVGMIHRHRVPGQRRYVYELPEHAWYTASISKNALYPTIARIAEATAKELGPRGAARVREMSGFFRFLEERIPSLLDEWNSQRETDIPSN